jgi:hypothetical protein
MNAHRRGQFEALGGDEGMVGENCKTAKQAIEIGFGTLGSVSGSPLP